MFRGVSFSGVVVTYNDGAHLEECLARLSFCAEVVVVDLGSTDDSVSIAERMGARIVHHEWVPVVERVRQFAVDQAKNQWVVFMDPDLMFPTHVVDRIRTIINENDNVGVICIPYRNFFLGKPVRHGRWGGNVAYPAVFRREAVELSKTAHRGFHPRPGFDHITLPGSENDRLVHYWADSRAALYQKVRRYIPAEGPARYAEGERFSCPAFLFKVPYAVFRSLLLKRGFLDGWMGVYLSFINGWWTWKYLLSLRDYQVELRQQGISYLQKPGRFSLAVWGKTGNKLHCTLPYKLPWGGWLLVGHDEFGDSIFRGTYQEQNELNFVTKFLSPGMVFFDLGANQGLYTIIAAGRVGKEGRVVAFEPVPGEIKRLRWNLAVNHRRNVAIEPMAVGCREGLAELFVCLEGKGPYSSLRPPAVAAPKKTIEVPITTLDSYVLQHDIRFIDLVKIDVEGGEWDVLRGGIDLFCSSPRPVVMCEFSDRRTRPWGYPAVEIYSFLAARDYKWFSITYAGKLLPSPPKAEYDYDNLVAVPDEKVELVQPFMGDI